MDIKTGVTYLKFTSAWLVVQTATSYREDCGDLVANYLYV